MKRRLKRFPQTLKQPLKDKPGSNPGNCDPHLFPFEWQSLKLNGK
jgi:hypothetical protein